MVLRGAAGYADAAEEITSLGTSSGSDAGKTSEKSGDFNEEKKGCDFRGSGWRSATALY